MHGRLKAALTAAMAATAFLAAPAAAYEELVPGGVSELSERVPVNVVFVGLEPDEVPWDQVRAELPDTAEPIVRSRAFYGIDEPLGLQYTYDYRPFYTSRSWEDRFFARLSALAADRPLTLFQELYNEQASNVLDVTDNAWIDAPKVEKHLIDTAPAGVDTRMPTIFFIDWYGREDFRFHVYAKTGEPDPDTGYDFGRERDSRKMTAWGGTTPDDEETGLGGRGVNRVWFHDLSAGPEAFGGSFNVDDEDLDGDGLPDYRIPPSWEYGAYRDAAALPGDLGKVTRYVGLDLLFTSSPLYPPYYEADKLPGAVGIDVNTVEDWTGLDPSDEYVNLGLFTGETRELPIGAGISVDHQDVAPDGLLFDCYAQFIFDVPCLEKYAALYPAFANLFLSVAEERDALLDGDEPYEVAMVNYATDDPDLDPFLLGFADDNWLDGTQSGVFSFVSPGIVEAGYGLTTTMIHELGHHSSMSHPHDGYDPATGTDFGPSGDTYFAWLGDYSNSMMSYIDVNWDFSQLDRDNSARHHGAGYALIANRIAGDVLASPRARRGLGDLRAADVLLARAQRALDAHQYRLMLSRARGAYRRVRAAAAKAGVPVVVREPSTFTTIPGDVGARRATRIAPGAVDRDPAEVEQRFQP